MKSLLASAGLVFVLGLVPAVLGHGDEASNMGHDMGAGMMGAGQAKPEPGSYAPSYFTLPDHAVVMYAHIAVMMISWVLVLPIAVMLSLARSRYTLAVQLAFLAANALGVVLAVSYNAHTPDLYPNNAHHKIGWLATCVVGAQVAIGLLGSLAGAWRGGSRRGSQPPAAGERMAFIIPVSSANMAKHHRLSQQQPYRLSNDSGQGTEPQTESLRSNSVSTQDDEEAARLHDVEMDYEDEDEDEDEFKDAEGVAYTSRRYGKLVRKIRVVVASPFWRVFRIVYALVDRTSLVLGYVTLCTGVITYCRFFEGHNIFTGLAHWIKGGIFFWLGLFTLGRWCGSFGEVGWAWNVRPKTKSQKWRPSAEFVESALIFTYGATNIFLEHLGGWGGEWSAQDLEHIAITVLFIGGGLCGMLIESTWIRDLLNTGVTETVFAHPEQAYPGNEHQVLEQPRQYAFSVNPIPALVILLLGIMMSSHTQESMISSMVHKQWGNLLAGASFARGFTYVLVYLKPPRSILPSRPPTELLASFGLIAGGIIFMASSGDTVDLMVRYDVDAMFIYTVTIGFVGLLMAWEILLLALKGWAVRREADRPRGSYKFA